MTVTPESPRALPAEELAKSLEGKVKKVCAEKTDEGLLQRAIEAAAGRPLIIFGSLYLAGQMYKYFE